MTEIQKFFSQGVADQIKIMGSVAQIKSMPKGTLSKKFSAVVTSRDGSLQVDFGGALYTVSAHALIPTSENVIPKVSDQLISDGEEFMIISVVRSIIDKAYSCDLVKIG